MTSTQTDRHPIYDALLVAFIVVLLAVASGCPDDADDQAAEMAHIILDNASPLTFEAWSGSPQHPDRVFVGVALAHVVSLLEVAAADSLLTLYATNGYTTNSFTLDLRPGSVATIAIDPTALP